MHLLLLASLMIGLVLACTPAETQPSRATPPSRGTAAFPVSIDHKFGRTSLAQQPSRVVTVGYSEQDPVLALGVKPVGVREWFGEQPYATFPWAKPALGDAQPQVLTMPFGELNYEAIAALRPDLIVATHSGIKHEEYTRLASIAPTLAQPSTYPDFGVPWQEQTRLIGTALGRSERAEQIIADAEAKVTAVRKKHPEFEGRTVAMLGTQTPGTYFLYSPQVPPVRVLASLGMQVPNEVTRLAGDSPNGIQISQEQLRLLDVDALIWYAASPEQRREIENDALYQQLRIGREGRTIFLIRWSGGAGVLSPAHLVHGAFSFATVLSVPYAVELLEPMLVAALDGNPATTAHALPPAA